MNRSRSLSTKPRKPDSVSIQDSSSFERGGNESTSGQPEETDERKQPAMTTIRDHFGKAAAADKRNMSSATSDRHDVDSYTPNTAFRHLRREPVLGVWSTMWATRLVLSRVKRRKRSLQTEADTMRLLMTINRELNKKLDCLNETVQRPTLQWRWGVWFETDWQENTKLSAGLDGCRKKEEDMQTLIKEAMFRRQCQARSWSCRHGPTEWTGKWYSRRNGNVKLLYVQEAAGSLESTEESERKALQVFHNRGRDLKHIKQEHTEAAAHLAWVKLKRKKEKRKEKKKEKRKEKKQQQQQQQQKINSSAAGHH